MPKKTFTPILRDINGDILFKSSQKITSETIKKIVKEKVFDRTSVNLTKTTIIKDLKQALKSGIYKTIFSESKDIKEVINVLKQISLTGAIIKELKQIKKNLPDTYSHILSVAALSIKICTDLKGESYNPLTIAKIGLVHDIGKSRLPKKILGKQSPLTAEEFKIIQEHPMIEYLLISHYLNNPKAFQALASFSHHERLDGSGYPRKIKKLSNYTQTIIPCDIFDALISHRPYRNEPFTIRAALDLLLAEAKKGRINRKFVKCLIGYVRKDKPHYKKVKPSAENRDAPPKLNNYGKRKK